LRGFDCDKDQQRIRGHKNKETWILVSSAGVG
jgi:hypothetical protein